ncbi:hypothetical protein [Nannocystis pusilla]|uniref:hypothetical protein n=1 Tax=Nannocystis pusilla TaxID=889268 RepID=UPI003B7DF047
MSRALDLLVARWSEVPPPLRERADAAALASAWQAVEAAWPEFADDPPGFFARVAPRLAPEADVAAVAWADLALADACLRTLPGALAAFEATYGEALDAALQAVGSAPTSGPRRASGCACASWSERQARPRAWPATPAAARCARGCGWRPCARR